MVAPVISSVSVANPRYGSALTINGTGFEAAQGSNTVSIGGFTQTVNTWSATQITISSVNRGANKYGVAVNVIVNSAANGTSNAFALTALRPQTGWQYVNIGTVETNQSNRISASPADLATGMQVAYGNAQGTGVVNIAATGVYDVDAAVTAFDYEVWQGDWGTPATVDFAPVVAGKTKCYVENGVLYFKDGKVANGGGWDWQRNLLVVSTDGAEDKANFAKWVRPNVRTWGSYAAGSNRDGQRSADGTISYAGTAPGNFAPDYLSLIIAQFQQAKDAGLCTILGRDSNCGQSGNQDATSVAYCTAQGNGLGGGPGGQNFWTTGGAQQREWYAQSLEYLAENYPQLFDIYEVLVEPFPAGVTQADQTAFLRELCMRIKAKDPDAVCMVGGASYFPNQIINAIIPDLDYVVYAANCLSNVSLDTDRLASALENFDTVKSMGYPVLSPSVGTLNSDDPTKTGLDNAIYKHVQHGIVWTIDEKFSRNSPLQYGTWDQTNNGPRVINQPQFDAIKKNLALAIGAPRCVVIG